MIGSKNQKIRLQPSLSHAVLRKWQDPGISIIDSLVYPVFIDSDPQKLAEIESLPDQKHVGVCRLKEHLEPLVRNGLKAVLLFGGPKCNSEKDHTGSCAMHADTPVELALGTLAGLFPDLLLIADVCLCAFTSHGHCGIPDLELSDVICADSTSAMLANLAFKYAKAGAHVVAPSDMIDGSVECIRKILDAQGLKHCAIMAYSPKFQSSLYGPFRGAADCSLAKNMSRCKYQLPISSKGMAIRSMQRDISEGADILIVKPAGWYQDIISCAVNLHPDYPIAGYQVSGEYTMIHHAAKAGAIDLKSAVFESITAIKRAGASIIVTYYAPKILEWLNANIE